MSRLSPLGALFAALLAGALLGCGGDPAAAGGATSQSVQGVATPSSVSVVTAKNAN